MLKSLCFFLAFCVMLLSVRPCCTDSDCSRDSVAKNEVPAKTPLSDKDCQGCSPFFTCGTCAGFVLTKAVSADILLYPSIAVEHSADYRQFYIQKISLAIWQPPKLS
jgi:hypothetical protein